MALTNIGDRILAAVRNNQAQHLSLLIEQNRHYAETFINEYHDDIGRPLLMIGSSKNSAAAVEVLLKVGGVNVNARSTNSGQTAAFRDSGIVLR